MTKRKVVYISGTRADYSLIRRALIKLDQHVDLTVIATCMHLSQEFGNTIQEIKKDGLKTVEVEMLMDDDTLPGMVKSFGNGVHRIAVAIEKLEPDLIFVEGDRGESLAGAIAGAHMNIPVVHHGGGDVGGSIDNKIRFSISVFADHHLVGNQGSYERLMSMGSTDATIHNVGEPGLDDIIEGKFTSKNEIYEKFKLLPEKKTLLFAQHPNTEEYHKVEEQMNEILGALDELGMQTIAIYSNADAGGRLINKKLKEFARENELFQVFPNLERADFLGMMNVCDVMVGNSSAGLVELPSLKKPFVCIGTRQKDRLRAGNVIEVDHSKDDIVSAVNKALYDEGFRRSLEELDNPYGDGHASDRIVDMIIKILGD